MFCRNCGRELPDGVKFCAGCGTPVQSQEPAAAPDFPVTEPVPAVDAPPVSEIPPISEIPPVSEIPPAADSSAGSGIAAGMNAIKRRGKSGMIVLGAAAVLVILAVALVVKLVGGLTGGGKGALQYAYLTDDYELMYLPDLKEKTEALEISDKNLESGMDLKFSPDGKSIYYKDSTGALYKAVLSDLKKSGSPERISRNVYGFRVLQDGRVLYVEPSSSDIEVSVYNGKESFRVVKSCSGYQLDEKEKNLYYVERSKRNDTLTLYKIALTKDAKEEKLLSGADSIYSPWSASVLVYGEQSDSSSSRRGNNTLTVYSCKPGGDATELVENIYGVSGVTVDGSKVSFYYTVEKKDSTYNQTSYSLYHYTGSADSDPIATGLYTSWPTTDGDGIFIYKKAPSVDGGRSDDDWYVNVGGKESVLDKVDPEAYISGIYVLSSKEVVLHVYEDGEPMLISYTLGKDSLTYSSTILDDEDFRMETSTDSSGNTVLYVYTNLDFSGYRTVADLSVYKAGGKLEDIAEEIFGAYVLENGAVYLITDIDNRGGYEFSVLKNGKPSAICDEVDTLCGFLDKTQFLYISDNDLYLWNGKDTRRIAKDVTRCWINNEAKASAVLFPGY